MILELWKPNEGSQSQKRLNVKKYAEINGLFWEWYTRARASNVPVDGPMLVEQARIIAERIGGDTFEGTSGWLEKWKRRHNIGQMNIAGEEDNVSQQTIASWSETVKELTKGYSPRDVWNEDELAASGRRSLRNRSLKGKNAAEVARIRSNE